MNSPCLKCFEVGQDLSVECFLCKKCCHLKCNKIPKTVYNYCDKNALNDLGFKWICETCTSAYSSPQSISLMENINNKLNEVEKIKGHLNDLENRFNKKVETYADVVNSNMKKNSENNKIIHKIEKNLTSVKENIKTKIDKDEENNARKRKQNNVIVFNVPESTSGDSSNDYKLDITKVKSVLKNKIVLEKDDIRGFDRIGPYQKDSLKPRPIVMKLSTVDKKDELIKLRNLVFVDDENLAHRVYINIDRTKKEQEQYKELVTILKRKRVEDPSKNFVIRNNQVVEYVMPFRLDPQKFWG